MSTDEDQQGAASASTTPPVVCSGPIQPAFLQRYRTWKFSAMEPSEVISERDPLLPNEPCVASIATPPRSLGKNKSGHILNSDSRNMIFHCYTYWCNREPERSVEDASNLLAEIGFKREKRSRNSLLIGRDDITDWRNRFLRDVECYRAEGRKIFYLDETWVTAGPTRSIVWTDTVVQKRGRLFARANGLTTGLKQPSGKGQRLIVTHIGSEDGFVDGCLNVFRGQKTGDYHEEMNGSRFEGWFNDVLQKLPAGSVIILDNAPCHSRREEKLPRTAWKKEEIQEWTVRAGCIVLRLPPYHCELNPIELVWAKVENGVAADYRDFKLSTVDAILGDKIKQGTAEDWRTSIQHVMDLEAKLRLDTSGSEHIQPIIIQLREDDTEESDDDCELSGIEPLDEE
ncbi:uncharacterized protein LOC119395162 [Rhipicephalus sanguineus]|uniref:uncharacterized protein LOC119395162 n=1 Tax=Rhipicephalus sanguineus TaxID=34632 RepID=UPI001894F2AD|nr:uncharacterized protein LOC119395162 [Rhipicephalus sanguineus]